MKRIILDLDGVLADIVVAAALWYEVDIPKEWPWGRYDAEKVLGLPGEGKQVWFDFPERFWVEIPWMPDGQAILKSCEMAVGAENVVICTHPTGSESFAGKEKWIARHIPAYRKRVVYAEAKWALAHPDALLVDDYGVNIGQFAAQGGQVCMVPRPWNDNWPHRSQALQYVNTRVLRFAQGAEL